MGLYSSAMSQASAQARNKPFRLFARASLLLACAMASQHTAAKADGVYVAGQGTTLEQAFSQALADYQGKKDAFWVVAAGNEAARLIRSGAGQELQRSLNTVRERGGVVYVCRSDLLRAGLREEDLLDGVASMYGYGAHEWAGLLPAKRTEPVFPTNTAQSQRILKTCTSDAQAVPQ